MIADACVTRSDDKVVALVEGMCFKKVPLTSFRARLSRIANQQQQRQAGIPKTTVDLTASRAAVTHVTAEAVDTSRPPHQQLQGQMRCSGIEATLGAILGEACGIDQDPSMNNRNLVQIGVDSLLLVDSSEAFGTVSGFPDGKG